MHAGASDGARSAQGAPAQGVPAHGAPAHGVPAHGGPANRPREARATAAYVLAVVLSAAVVLAQWRGWLGLPLDTTEVLAFVSGGWSVWLAARNSPWTWPIGVMNGAFFVVLFWGAALYFDMALNAAYVASGLWGWWLWLFGGAPRIGRSVRRTERPVGRVGGREAGLLALAGGLLAGLMWWGGLLIRDAAPLLDAVTNALSLVAQWLLMRRLYEHWFVWIAADLLYVPLYLDRGLPLTAVLYVVFLLMCLRGLVEWRAVLRRQAAGLAAPSPTVPAGDATS